MARQRGVNTVTTKNYFPVTGSGIKKQFSIQYDDYGRISSLEISKITTRIRNVSSDNSTKNDDEIRYNSTVDMDSHAGNYFFGKNF